MMLFSIPVFPTFSDPRQSKRDADMKLLGWSLVKPAELSEIGLPFYF
jgi:hypothetical protein